MSLTSLVPHWDTRQPLTPLLAALPSLLLFLLFLLPSSRLLKLALLPPLIIAALYVPIAYTTGDPAQDFGLASASFQRVLVALDRIVLSDADRDFRRLKDVPPPKIGTLGRVWWAFENVNNARGAGWSWEVRNTPKGGIRARSRWACARAHAGLILLLYLCMDGLSTFMQKQPYFRQQVALVDCGFVEQQIYMVCGAAAGALALNMIYSAVCAMGLTLGIWTPNECPALFGSVPKASSLRGFWGHSWHQVFRRVFTVPTTALLSFLRLSPSSPLAVLLSVCVPFFLSALQHAFGTYVMARNGKGALVFFLVQPVGLILERFVAVVATRAGINTSGRLVKLVGFVWTATWLLGWSRWFFDELVQSGMWEVDPAPFSVVKGLTTGKWLQ